MTVLRTLSNNLVTVCAVAVGTTRALRSTWKEWRGSASRET